jgi:hypothetical protein
MVARSPGVFWDVVDGRTVVCEPSSGTIYRLNATAAYLWEACGDASVASLAARLAEVFPDQEVPVLELDTEHFVESMKAKGLLTAGA